MKNILHNYIEHEDNMDNILEHELPCMDSLYAWEDNKWIKSNRVWTR